MKIRAVPALGLKSHRELATYHVRGRALLQRAVESPRRKVSCYVNERDAAKAIRGSAQHAPGCEIRRLQDGVNARRPRDSELKRPG